MKSVLVYFQVKLTHSLQSFVTIHNVKRKASVGWLEFNGIFSTKRL